MKNRPDYDFSKHVKVPDEWIEKALAVPSAHAEESRGFSGRSRRIAAAASIVLVLGLSVSLYFVFRNIHGHSAAVAPYTEPTATAVTEPPTAVTNAPTLPDPTGAEPTKSPVLVPTQPYPTPPTAASAESGAAPSDEPTNPATEPATQPATVPSVPPTQPATAPPEPPTQPATAPPEPPTQPETLPTAPNIAQPTEKPQDDPTPSVESDIEILVPFGILLVQSSESDADETIYCRFYNEAGTMIGERDWYASSHMAQLLWIDQEYYLYYTALLPSDAYAAPAGRYQYVFYDSAGRTLLHGYC